MTHEMATTMAQKGRSHDRTRAESPYVDTLELTSLWELVEHSVGQSLGGGRDIEEGLYTDFAHTPGVGCNFEHRVS